MHRRPGRIAALLALAAWLAAPLAGGETAPPGEGKEAPQAEGEAIHRFPGDPEVWVDRQKREVYVRARLSPDLRGMFASLEFLLIAGEYSEEADAWSYEKGYESVFVTNANPANLHLALLLAGFRPGPLQQKAPPGLSKGTLGGEFGRNVPEDETAGSEKDAKRAVAPMLDILVRWEENGRTGEERIERFLTDRRTGQPPAPTPWAFTGSYLETNARGEKVLAANVTHIVAGIFHDESALINLPFYTLNPHRSEGGLEMNANCLPAAFSREKEIVEGHTRRTIRIPRHRPVTLVIRQSDLERPDPNVRLKQAEDGEPEPKTP